MPRAFPLGDGVTDTFSFTCHVCGETVDVDKGKVQPHRCRVDLDAQRGCGCTEEAIIRGCATHHTPAPAPHNHDQMVVDSACPRCREQLTGKRAGA